MTHSPQHLDRLRLRHLRLLELIDEHRSLRAIAIILNLTQPAVSQMLKDLELAFGVTFVDRSARGVTLTRPGRLALERARSGLATFDHLAGELQADLPPLVRIGTNPAIMYKMLPAALGRLGVLDGRLRFKVRTGPVNDMLDELVAGELDCYIGRVDWDQLSPAALDVLRYDPLTETELVIACSVEHPLANREDLTARDLLDHSWALTPEGSTNRIALETAFRDQGLEVPVPVVETALDPNALILLAKAVPFLIYVTREALDTHVAAGEFRVLELPELHLPTFQIGFVSLAHNEDFTPLQALRQVLIEVVRQH